MTIEDDEVTVDDAKLCCLLLCPLLMTESLRWKSLKSYEHADTDNKCGRQSDIQSTQRSNREYVRGCVGCCLH